MIQGKHQNNSKSKRDSLELFLASMDNTHAKLRKQLMLAIHTDEDSDIGSSVISRLSVKEKFEFYKKQWKENTRYSSTIREMVSDSNFKEIIGLGFNVLPYIFKELKSKTDRRRWISALHRITGADPVKPEHADNLDKIVKDWIEWGKLSKYI